MFSDKKLLQFYNDAKQHQYDLVAASVIATEGSTYRKSGALMLINSQQQSCGLISGGCFENDLMHYAQELLVTKKSKRIQYDLRGDDDIVWGLGLGCNGLVDLWLQPFFASDQYGALGQAQHIATAEHHTSQPAWLIRSLNETGINGYGIVAQQQTWFDINLTYRQQLIEQLPESPHAALHDVNGEPFFTEPIQQPCHLLVLGAGADCVPLVEIANTLGWRVTLCDHRQGYLDRVSSADVKCKVFPDQLHQQQRLNHFDAAVVMSHHFTSDAAYLGQLVNSSIPYLGVLGPKSRTEQLMAEWNPQQRELATARLFNPIGLDLGGESPQSIALAICAEITAQRAGKLINQQGTNSLRNKTVGIHDNS